MRRIKEILRLKFELHLDNRQIARSCNIPHSTGRQLPEAGRSSGFDQALPPDMSDTDVERLLFPTVPADRKVPIPDFEVVYAESIGHKHVTLEPALAGVQESLYRRVSIQST